MLVLDTQALIWSRFDDQRLGNEARQMIAATILQRDVAVSTFTLWEIALLHRKGRMNLIPDIRAWWESLAAAGLKVIDVSTEIAIRANELEDFHDDPADRIIVATALDNHLLMTSDAKILNWRGGLERVNARE